MKRLIKRLIGPIGYKLVPFESSASEPVNKVVSVQSRPLPREENPDITDSEWETFVRVKPYTMTSLERVITAIRSVAYVVGNHIAGDIVECGVWRGGTAMAMACTLMEHGDTSRFIYLYDTFEGMTEPTDVDADFRGSKAAALLSTARKSERLTESHLIAYASLEDVYANLGKTQYPVNRIMYVKGPVEKTIPSVLPDRIALLRLDTDWYDSTRHELIHLYPRLSSGGVLIVDDYGHWQGCKRAVDEFFRGRLFLNRIDYTGRLAIKP